MSDNKALSEAHREQIVQMITDTLKTVCEYHGPWTLKERDGAEILADVVLLCSEQKRIKADEFYTPTAQFMLLKASFRNFLEKNVNEWAEIDGLRKDASKVAEA